MIRLRLKGRLGNQLFIYAFAKAIKKKFGQEVLIYDRTDEKNTMWHSHLNRFKLSSDIQFTNNKKDVMVFSKKALALFIIDRIYMKFNSNRSIYNRQCKTFDNNIKNGLFLLMDGYHEFPSDIPSNLFCDGYFQSEKYFYDIREDLLNELIPKDKLNSNEKLFLDSIKQSESVCLTIRLGDYINNSAHQVCTKDFYFMAMKKMKKLYPNCKFFVFSDEIKKASKVFDFPYKVIYDDGQSKDAVSLYIMSHCKHFIISNSSFSWWAQYLSQNDNKTVIAPDRWYAKDIPCDIMQQNWEIVSCEE